MPGYNNSLPMIQFSNVHSDVTETLLKSLFESMGSVAHFDVHPVVEKETLQGCCQFIHNDDCHKALKVLQGIRICGCILMLELVNEAKSSAPVVDTKYARLRLLRNIRRNPHRRLFNSKYASRIVKHNLIYYSNCCKYRPVTPSVNWTRRPVLLPRLIPYSSVPTEVGDYDSTPVDNTPQYRPDCFNFPPVDPLLASLNRVPVSQAYLAVEQLKFICKETPGKAEKLLNYYPQLAASIVLILQHQNALPSPLPPEATIRNWAECTHPNESKLPLDSLSGILGAASHYLIGDTNQLVQGDTNNVIKGNQLVQSDIDQVVQPILNEEAVTPVLTTPHEAMSPELQEALAKFTDEERHTMLCLSKEDIDAIKDDKTKAYTQRIQSYFKRVNSTQD